MKLLHQFVLLQNNENETANSYKQHHGKFIRAHVSPKRTSVTRAVSRLAEQLSLEYESASETNSANDDIRAVMGGN